MSNRQKYNALCPYCQKVNEDVAANMPQPPAGGVMKFEKNCTHCKETMRVVIRLPQVLEVEATKVEDRQQTT